MFVASTGVSGSAVLSAARFDVSFVDQDGVPGQAPLADCWSWPFEDGQPVRRFMSHRGRRGFTGLWWFSTTSEHVGYESWLERDHLMALDADVDVVAVASQPFWLSWMVNGRRVRHAPDFFARLVDGTGVVIDVRDDDQIEPEDAAKFAVSADACASVGWAYRRVGALDPVLVVNLRWLAGYRHPRCSNPGFAVRLLEVFADPTPLLHGARLVADPIAVLPVVFNLLWRRVLWADLASPFGPDTAVCVAGGGR